MSLVVTEERPCQALDRDNPRCLACGGSVTSDPGPVCTDPDCGAVYFVNGMPCMEFWPIDPADYEGETPFVTALVSLNNGNTWDWCDQHREYEEDHPLGQRSCGYYAAEARLLRPIRDTYLSAPPESNDPTYWETKRRIDRNPFF